MDSVPKNEILEFPDDVIQVIRKEYDLDKPGRMDQAIAVFDDWVKKQSHFNRKDFPKDYLERQIILCKGSVERAKQKLDRNCTFRTLVPRFYERINLKTEYKDSNILIDALLPKLTEDYYRIYALRNIGQRFNHGITDYFRYVLLYAEYVTRYDYTKGFVIIVDYTETNLYELVKALDIIEFRQAMNIVVEGYGMRIKGIHIVTPSKAVDSIVTIFKQILSAKIGERLQVHKNYESLHKVVSKHLLPPELGGSGKSVAELHDQWLDILSSEKNQEYFQEMRNATTNEKFRLRDDSNEEYMGMPGTFKTLNLD